MIKLFLFILPVLGAEIKILSKQSPSKTLLLKVPQPILEKRLARALKKNVRLQQQELNKYNALLGHQLTGFASGLKIEAQASWPVFQLGGEGSIELGFEKLPLDGED
jgi:hypothetical protein